MKSKNPETGVTVEDPVRRKRYKRALQRVAQRRYRARLSPAQIEHQRQLRHAWMKRTREARRAWGREWRRKNKDFINADKRDSYREHAKEINERKQER